MSAVSLLESREQRYIKTIDNNSNSSYWPRKIVTPVGWPIVDHTDASLVPCTSVSSEHYPSHVYICFLWALLLETRTVSSEHCPSPRACMFLRSNSLPMPSVHCFFCVCVFPPPPASPPPPPPPPPNIALAPCTLIFSNTAHAHWFPVNTALALFP